jgi:hypothetical protein
MRFLTEYKADGTADMVYRACPPLLGAIGIKPAVVQGSSMVFTQSRDNREEEVHHVLTHLPPAIGKLRSFSPVWRRKMAAGAGG